MKLIESKIGGKVYVKSLNRFLEVSPENISLLSKLGLTEYFEKDADNNKEPSKPTVRNRKRKDNS